MLDKYLSDRILIFLGVIISSIFVFTNHSGAAGTTAIVGMVLIIFKFIGRMAECL